MKKGLSKTAVIIFFIAVLIIGGLYLYQRKLLKGCTTEARICPDGTEVKRVPPSCEFATCPNNQPAHSRE